MIKCNAFQQLKPPMRMRMVKWKWIHFWILSVKKETTVRTS